MIFPLCEWVLNKDLRGGYRLARGLRVIVCINYNERDDKKIGWQPRLSNIFDLNLIYDLREVFDKMCYNNFKIKVCFKGIKTCLTMCA